MERRRTPAVPPACSGRAPVRNTAVMRKHCFMRFSNFNRLLMAAPSSQNDFADVRIAAMGQRHPVVAGGRTWSRGARLSQNGGQSPHSRLGFPRSGADFRRKTSHLVQGRQAVRAAQDGGEAGGGAPAQLGRGTPRHPAARARLPQHARLHRRGMLEKLNSLVNLNAPNNYSRVHNWRTSDAVLQEQTRAAALLGGVPPGHRQQRLPAPLRYLTLSSARTPACDDSGRCLGRQHGLGSRGDGAVTCGRCVSQKR